MHILLFSSIIWLLISIITATNKEISVCGIPKKVRFNGVTYIKHKDFKNFALCKKNKHKAKLSSKDAEIEEKDDKISDLSDRISDLTDHLYGDVYSDNSDSEDTREDDITNIYKDPKKLAKHIQCDETSNETKEKCIIRLQNLLQRFIDIHQELPIGNDESPMEQNERLKKLVTTERQKSSFYSQLYDRCDAGYVMTARENKLAEDYVKCRSKLLDFENASNIPDHSIYDSSNPDDKSHRSYTSKSVSKDCPTGFRYEADACLENICECENGEAKTGIECITHGKEDCHPSGCNKGFYYTSDRCLENDWKQAGGTSVYFKVLDYTMTLNQAHINCQASYPGARLATILTQIEFDLIRGFAYASDFLAWIDLTASGDIGVRSNYYWGNGGGLVKSDSWWFHLRTAAPWTGHIDYKKHAVFRDYGPTTTGRLHNNPDDGQNPAICELRL